MSVSDRLRRIIEGAPWLWINTPTRAAAAAVAALLVLAPTVMFENSEPWHLLATAKPDKDAARETHLMTTLAWTSATPVDTVIMVGGSSAREFSGLDSRLSRLLSARCGRAIHFVNAGTSSQTMAESWALAEGIPDAQRRLVVVGINYSGFEQGPAEIVRELRSPLLPLKVPRALKHAVKSGGYSSPDTTPWMNQTSWLVRRLDQVTFQDKIEPFEDFVRSEGQTPWQGPQHIYRAPALDRTQKAGIVRRMTAERLHLFNARHKEALALWHAFLARFIERKSAVLFLALPESASMEPMNRRVGSAFASDLSTLERDGARVADWRTNHGLPEASFYDQQHLLESGRHAIEPRFVDLLVNTLPDCSP
tara:strand:- start:2512 stop:3606 length:1095 start_codon:yes stop_codon:yes gene_type:complete